MADFIQTQGPKTLLLEPRGHYKTTIGSEGYPIWRRINDQNDTCLLSNAVFANAQKFLRIIKNHAESNALLRWVFPELVPRSSDKWTETELVFPRTNDVKEPSIGCIGVGGTAVGLHFACIIKDDLVNEDHIISQEQMQKVIDWHKYSTSLLISPAKDRECVTGTRWAFYDVYSHIMDHEPSFKTLKRSVIEKGQPIFPEEFSLETIQEIQDRQGPYIFSCQYMNEPVDPARTIIRQEWLQYIEDLDGPESLANLYKRCSRFIVVDPALSQKRQGDYTGVVVVYVDHEYNMYVEYAEQHRISPDAVIDRLFELVWVHEPGAVGIEIVSLNQMKVNIDRAMNERKKWFYCQELKPNTHISKEMRVRASLQPLFARRKVWIRKGQRALIDQLLKFPFGSHDDVVDALAYVPHMWTAGAAPSDMVSYDPDKDPFNMQYILSKLGHTGDVDKPRGTFPFVLTKEK
jgi:phage terminase large subunit-like protein